MKRIFLKQGLCLAMIAVLALVSCRRDKDNDVLIFSVSGTDIAASYDGGEANFYYAVENGSVDGAVKCSADVDWISGFTYIEATETVPAAVFFNVEGNDGDESRTGKINVAYTSSVGNDSWMISVKQAGRGSRDTEFNLKDLVGTYRAEAYAPYGTSSICEIVWEMIIMQKDDESLYIDGLLPSTVGQYVKFGDNRVSATAVLNENSDLVVASALAECRVVLYSGTFYFGYTPCVQYSRMSHTMFYDDELPDLTFTYHSSTGTWESDYGVIAVGCGEQDINDIMVYVSSVYPTITLTKVSDNIPDIPSDDDSLINSTGASDNEGVSFPIVSIPSSESQNIGSVR